MGKSPRGGDHAPTPHPCILIIGNASTNRRLSIEDTGLGRQTPWWIIPSTALMVALKSRDFPSPPKRSDPTVDFHFNFHRLRPPREAIDYRYQRHSIMSLCHPQMRAWIKSTWVPGQCYKSPN